MKNRKYKLNLTEKARQKIGWRKGLIFTKTTKICEVCGKEFQTVPSSSKQHCCSRECQFKRLKKPLYKIACRFCSKMFIPKAHKSNPIFCSRKCAVRFRFIEHINKIRPSDSLPRINFKKCQICGYNKFPDILERHHQDMNHKNNIKKNLMILCPNCHDEIHLKSRTGRFKFIKPVHFTPII